MANAPDVAYILELKSYLEDRFSAQKSQIRAMRTLRKRVHDLNVPEAYKKTAHEVRTPLLQDMEQRVTATLTAREPAWESTPLSERRKAQEEATLREHWLVAAHKRMDKECGRPVLTNAISAAVGDGMGVLKYIYRPYSYPYIRRRKEEMEPENAHLYTQRVEEKYRSGPFPFAWRDTDPLSYFFHEADDGVDEVLLIESKPLKPTLDKLQLRYAGGEYLPAEMGRAIPPDELGGSSTVVEVLETWTGDYVSYVIDGKLAKQIKHGWGKVPFFHFAGLSSHENTPERTFLPVCWAFLDLIPLLDRLLTMKANWMYMASFPQPIFRMGVNRLQKMMAGAPDAPPPEIKLGEILALYADESFELVTPPPVAADLNQMVQLVQGMLQTVGLGNVMRGEAPTGDASGYLVNQLITAGLLTYKPVVTHAQTAFDGGGQLLLWWIDNVVKRPVPVWGKLDGGKGGQWLELGPEQIRGFYASVESKIDPMLPTNEIMMGRFGLESWKAEGISWETYIEDYMKRNPDEEEDRRLIEKAKRLIEEKLIYEAGVRAGVLSPIQQPEAPQLGPGGLPGSPLGVMGSVALPGAPGMGLPITPPNPTGVPAPNQGQLTAAGVQAPTGGSYGQRSEIVGGPV